LLSQVSTERTLTVSTPALDQAADVDVAQVGVGATSTLAVDDDVLGEVAGVDARRDVLRQPQRAVGAALGDPHGDAALGAAVLLADDDVLRDVDETPGEVAGVGRPQRGVGQTLPGAVRRDEVLEHGQALAEVRLDRPRDDLALGVGDQPRMPAIWRTCIQLPRAPEWTIMNTGLVRGKFSCMASATSLVARVQISMSS
jgi:hypothetical protein